MSRRTYSIAFFIANVATEPEFFLSRSGRPKLVFRIAVDRDPWTAGEEEPNQGRDADFFTVECIGPQWLDLGLQRGDLIAVLAVPRSRDVTTAGERRVVTFFRPLHVVVIARKQARQDDQVNEVSDLVSSAAVREALESVCTQTSGEGDDG